ncbi:hypothetical protein DXG01_009224 [Tephrocybe rancida]|nr:hypothetical protein DXG01_009224 [Tephrocybe rancida]
METLQGNMWGHRITNSYRRNPEDQASLLRDRLSDHADLIEVGVSLLTVRYLTTLSVVNKILLSAAKKGVASVVEEALDNGAPINVRDKKGRTPLSRAAAKGDESVVQVLLRQPRVDFDGNTDGYYIPLHSASSNGHTKVVQLLTENGVSINVGDWWGATALYWASANGHEGVVQVLLRQPGVDFDGNTDGDYIPLHIASKNGHTTVVELLTENGAPINARDHHWGATALYWALEQGHEGVVRVLVCRPGVDLGGNTDGAFIPLHNALSKSHTKMVQLLTENGAPINVRDQWGQTALYWASTNGHEGVVQVLLRQPGVDFDGNTNDDIPLHITLSKGHLKMVQLLTEYGAPINTRDQWGRTALF